MIKQNGDQVHFQENVAIPLLKRVLKQYEKSKKKSNYIYLLKFVIFLTF